MTTLPPESGDADRPQGPGSTEPGQQSTPDQPHTVPEPPQTPPTTPPAPPAPPVPPAQSQPAQPQYQGQQQPPLPPQGQPQQPGAYQPPPGAYQAPPGQQPPPPGGGYQQPYGYAQPPVSNPTGQLQLNFWLSVFLGWIPALIFFLVDKDKGDQRLRQLHADNLNFTLLRVIVGIIAIIPYIGWLIGGIGALVLFIFHIIAAAKVADAYQTGQSPFIFNIPMVK